MSFSIIISAIQLSGTDYEYYQNTILYNTDIVGNKSWDNTGEIERNFGVLHLLIGAKMEYECIRIEAKHSSTIGLV